MIEETAERLAAAVDSKDWDAATATLAATPARPRLSGPRGAALLARIDSQAAAARDAAERLARLDAEAAALVESGDFAGAAGRLGEATALAPGRGELALRRDAAERFAGLAARFETAARTFDADALAALVADMSSAGMPAAPLGRFSERLASVRGAMKAAEKALDEELAGFSSAGDWTGLFGAIRRHAGTPNDPAARSAARRLDRIAPAEGLLTRARAAAEAERFAEARQALAAVPEGTIPAPDAAAEAARVDAAEAAAFSRESDAFQTAVSHGREAPAEAALGALRRLGAPQEELDASAAKLEMLHRVIEEGCVRVRSGWRERFRGFRFGEMRDYLSERAAEEPLADVRTLAAGLRAWAEENESAFNEIEWRIGENLFGEAAEILSRLASAKNGPVAPEDASAMLAELAVRRRAARRRAIRTTATVLAVLALATAIGSGLASWRRTFLKNQAELDGARTLDDHVRGLFEPLKSVRAERLLPDRLGAARSLYHEAQDLLEKRRGPEARAAMLEAKETFRSVYLDAAKLYTGQLADEADEALEARRWNDARASARVALSIAGRSRRISTPAGRRREFDALLAPLRRRVAEADAGKRVEEALEALAAGAWTNAFAAANAALEAVPGHVAAERARDEALSRFRPVATFRIRNADGFDWRAEDDGSPLPAAIPLRPGVHVPARTFVAWRNGARYVAVLPPTTAEWDGTNTFDLVVGWSPPAGSTRSVPLPGGLPPLRMHWCPPGWVSLGSPLGEPGRSGNEIRRDEAVSDGFYMAETEVTQAQWEAVMGTTQVQQSQKALDDPTPIDGQTNRERWNVSDGKTGADICVPAPDRPVYHVNLGEATEFCRRLSERERAAGRLPDGFRIGLPTSRQWEHACRAGSETTLPNGAPLEIRGIHDAPALDGIAWYGGNSSVGYSDPGWDTADWKEKQYPGGYAGPRDVATKEPNAWGLHDMLGNVWEWCIVRDIVEDRSNPRRVSLSISVGHALRGGAWNSPAWQTRPARVAWEQDQTRLNSVGFRVALFREERDGSLPPWEDLPSAASHLAAARQALSERKWERARDEADAAAALDAAGFAESSRLRSEAVGNMKPVARIAPCVGGRPLGSAFTVELDGRRTPFPFDWDARGKGTGRLVAIRNGVRFESERPLSDLLKGAEWDGTRDVPVELDYAPAAGTVRAGPLARGTGKPLLELAWCPAGSFTMGSPLDEPGRETPENRMTVAVPRGFWLGRTEVTQGQWREVMGRNLLGQVRLALDDPTQYPKNGGGTATLRQLQGVPDDADPGSRCGDCDDDTPVYFVNWHDAMEFCQYLTERERRAGRLPDGFEYTLPTECQWEYACRAGRTTALPDGSSLRIRGRNDAPALDGLAWYGGNSSVGFEGRGWDTAEWEEKQYPGGRAAPRRVGRKKANAWGFFDMLGNVAEWCVDPYGNNSDDPLVRGRVIRGGAWDSTASSVRPAARDWHHAGWRNRSIGFRVALVQTDEGPPRWSEFLRAADPALFGGR